jgi:glutamate racemase
VIGVIEPTARRAIELSQSGRIGVIGTRGTIDSGAYQRAVQSMRPDASTSARACPLFVPLAEEGWTDGEDPIARSVAERYLAPLVAEGVDTLILGCTHYPLLEDVIRDVVGSSIALADAAEAVADEVSGLISGPSDRDPTRRYYVTDVPRGFCAVAERFLGAPIDDPIELDL